MHTISTTAAGRRWEDWLTEVARTYRTLLLSHRDGARLVAGTRPLPDSLPLLDGCIAAFQQATGCGPGQALQCLTTLIAFVRGFVLDEEAELHRGQEQAEPQTHQGTKRIAPRTPQPVPHLDAAMHDVGSPNGEGTFEYGLHVIVDGIRAALHSHTTSRNDGQATSHVREAAVKSPVQVGTGPAGPRTSWLTDPDGTRIELVQWPAVHPDGISAADFA